MAKTIINLSDPVSTFVSKTNTISDHIGDITQLNVPVSADSDIVQAINYIHSISEKTDSSDIINLIDSAYVQARQTGVTQSSIMPFFQKDSDNGIGLDSSEGRFFIPPHTVNTSMIETSAITTDKIAGSAITGSKISDDQINSQHYVTGSIDAEHLATGSVTTDKILDDNVTTIKLAAGSVTSAKIATDAVTSGEIAANAVGTSELAADAVGQAELKSVVTLNIYNSSGTIVKTLYGAGS